MGLGKDRQKVNARGGGLFEVSTDGGNNWDDLGYLNETEFHDEDENELSHDEVGDLINILYGNKIKWAETSLKQTSIDEINLLRNYRGKVIQARYQVKLQNGKIQLYAYGECILVGTFSTTFNTSERNLPFRIYMLKGANTDKYYDVAETTNDPVQAGDWPTVN